MVAFMPKFGWEPVVLTTKTDGPLPVLMPQENVIRIGKNYDSKKKLVVSEEGYKGIPVALKAPYFFYRNLKMELASVDRFIFSWGREIKKNKELIMAKNPDLIVGSSYPPVSIWQARYFSDYLKKPWVPDLQDPLSLWNNAKFPFVKKIDEKIDKYLIKTASGVVTISSHLAQKMRDFYKKPVEVVYNGFDEADEDPKNNVLAEKGAIKFYYAGRFHPHRIPAVKLFLDWLAEIKTRNFVFVLRSLGPLEANDEIAGYAKEKGIFGKINLLPPSGPEVIFQEEKEASALILFDDLNRVMRNSEGTLPGKLMEYLPFRAPIIAVNRPDSEIGEILKETSRGWLVSNLKELEGAGEAIFQGKTPEFNWEKVNKFSREAQAKKFCEFLDLCLRK